MKKLFILFATLLITFITEAQMPDKMSYQAVVRDADNELLINQEIGMRISILQGGFTGETVYTETQTPTTNINGLLTIEIGGGAGFDTIDWAAGPYFIKTETDPAGGTNYSLTATSQLLSVPFALHAGSAEYALHAGSAENTVPENHFETLVSYLEQSEAINFVDFTVRNTQVEPNDTVYFYDHSLIDANSWSWDFGDGNTSHIQNPTNIYSDTGQYTVSLTVSDDVFSMTKTKEAFVHVFVFAPIAHFLYEKSNDNFLEVAFTNQSENAVSYNWDFGDGQTSTEENPIHIYAEPGQYIVQLTAENRIGVTHSYSRQISIIDPLQQLNLLTGGDSKTWKLYRVGTSMGVGPNIDSLRGWWALENDGSRPCKYLHEFTFQSNGAFVFEDNGVMWGETDVFIEDLGGQCIEALPANMIGPGGEDLTAWLSGAHTFDYNTATNSITLSGQGAWIGLVKLGTDGEVAVPQTEVTFKVHIEEHDGFDLMTVLFIYNWGVWDFTYVHYSNPDLEPELVME